MSVMFGKRVSAIKLSDLGLGKYEISKFELETQIQIELEDSSVIFAQQFTIENMERDVEHII